MTTYLLLGRTGDIASVLPFLKHEADAGEKPRLVVSKDYSGVLEGVSYVEAVEFAGKVEQLKDGWDWSRGQFGEVKSLQVIGERNTVAECTYQPAGQDGARTTSFVKEAWKLAGKMPLWDSVLPLVFDRRDPAREEKLIVSCGLKKPGRKKPLILVSTSGTSSPFPHADLLYQLVWLKFKGRFNVLRLPQAERFYDLLALYERAHCLVTTDSAPLHLARACPDLPVMALTNDRPLLWNGSAWLPNWHWCCRYHDFPDRALQLLEAIHTCRDKPKHPFIHVWNAYDGGPAPERYTRDALPVFAGMCGRDSANVLKDEKRIPYLKDCLRMGLQRAGDTEPVCLTHPDVVVGEFPKETASPLFAYRLDSNGFRPVGDLFCAPKQWWKEHLPEIPDYLLGRDVYWPEGMRVLFQKHSAQDCTGIARRRGT